MKKEMSRKYTNKEGIEIVTNYKDAVNWLHNDFVMCNNIPEIDESIYYNLRFEMWDNENGGDPLHEIYQWFITDANESDVEYLENRFGLKFTYSDLLDTYILCVTHYGTAWDYVYCTDSEMDDTAKRAIIQGQKEVLT